MTGASTRLFVAVDPPAAAQESIAGISNGLAGARWTRVPQFHVTLKFFGAVEEAKVARIAAALAGVAVPAFSLAAAGFGVFPSFRSPRVLWIGLSPPAPLAALHEAIESRVAAFTEVEADEKPYSPHLTLARLNPSTAAAVRAWMEERERFVEGPWEVDAFFLYASHLTPRGAVHRRLQEYPLSPREGGLRAAR